MCFVTETHSSVSQWVSLACERWRRICSSILFLWVPNCVCSQLFHYIWAKRRKSYLQLSGILTCNIKRGFPLASQESSLNCMCVFLCPWCWSCCICMPQECNTLHPACLQRALVHDWHWQKKLWTTWICTEWGRNVYRFLGRLSGLSALLCIYLDTLIATEHSSFKEFHERESASRNN